jgi:hypothetical protein
MPDIDLPVATVSAISTARLSLDGYLMKEIILLHPAAAILMRGE